LHRRYPSFIPPEKQGVPVVAILVCYTGDLAEGERVVAPLRRLATPIADVIAPMPYPAIFALMEVGEIRGLQHHFRSLFLQSLNDEVLHALVEASLTTLTPETLVQLRVLGGAMSRVAADATAFAHRDKQALVLVSNFGPPAADPAARTQLFWQALSPYADGVYVNFLADEGEQRVHDAYPPRTYMRLAALKNRYDPSNLFHLNQNIKPAQ
jgi:FAD/FMN-containing dehydrogenase